MELYQLLYFIEVARHRNFTRAAQHLKIAQPALSQQMRKLEEELGAPLFIRGARQTQLSAAGEAFFPRAQAVLAAAETARQTVAEVAKLKRGRLVIACIPTLSACWLPARIRQFRRQHPDIELMLREESSAVVADLVQNGSAEFGLTQLPANREMFEIKELFAEPFQLAVPASHKLARARSARLDQLADEAFIFYKGQVRSVTLEACRAAGFEPRIACESGELETIRALVQIGLGIAILPRSALSAPSRQSKIVSLAGASLERSVGIISRRGHQWSPAAESFVQICCQTPNKPG